MSLILEGIDLPKEGLTTNINILSNGDIYVSAFDGKRTNYEVLRNSAIQIPKGHGRLIDADTKIKAELYDSENGAYIEKEMTIEQWFMFMQNDAPTILEAEE